MGAENTPVGSSSAYFIYLGNFLSSKSRFPKKEASSMLSQSSLKLGCRHVTCTSLVRCSCRRLPFRGKRGEHGDASRIWPDQRGKAWRVGCYWCLDWCRLRRPCPAVTGLRISAGWMDVVNLGVVSGFIVWKFHSLTLLEILWVLSAYTGWSGFCCLQLISFWL